jgi:hypothetical protein
MAVSAEKSARLCPQPIQVDTAHFWPETRAIPGFQSFVPSVNRTAVTVIGNFNVYLFDGPHEERDQYDGIMVV